MATPLRIGLGINFGQLDGDLRKVADRIESLGSAASLKLGANVGDLVSGKMSGDDVASAVSQAGARLAAGMASGVRKASSLMLGLTAHIEKMLNKLVGSAVTIFRRIDAAMKFPHFDNFFKTAQLKFSNFSAIWRKPLTDLDIAVAGGFGGLIEKLARVLKAVMDGVAAQISTAMKDAVASVAAEFAKLGENARSAEASAAGLLKDVTAAARAAPKFARFPADLGKGLKSTVAGPRIGRNVQMTAPVPAPSRRISGNVLGLDVARVAKAAEVANRAVAMVGSTTLKVGAALVSVPLRGVVAFSRLSNVLGSLGDVGKASYRKLFEGHGLIVGSALGVVKAVGGVVRAVTGIGPSGAKGFDQATAGAAKFTGATRTARSSVGVLGGAVRSVGGQIAVAFGLVGIGFKVAQFFKNSIKNAAALNETISRTQVVFGGAFGPIEAQANRMSRAFGIARETQLSLASGFGAMAQGAGYGEAASASLANRLTKMAIDLSSSVNIPLEEAGQKIRSALAGEAEPLRQFGANITETNVKAYALSHGIASSAKAMTDQQKVAARAALIMEGLGYAQGDIERTAGSAANQFRAAGGGIQEFGIRLGQVLLPAITAGTEAFNELLGAVLDATEGSSGTIESWASKVASAMGTVGMIVRNRGDFFHILQLRVGEFAENAIRWIGVLPENFGAVLSWIGRNWFNMLKDMANFVVVVFSNIVENAQNFGVAVWDAIQGRGFQFTWKPLLDGFQAATEQLPELIKPALISVDAEVQELWDRISENEKKRSQAIEGLGKPMKPAAPVLPGAGEAASKEAEYRIGGALEIGSKEAFSAISRNVASNKSTTDIAKQGVAVQRTIAQGVKETNKILLDRLNGIPKFDLK
jgi:hypothetical protein